MRKWLLRWCDNVSKTTILENMISNSNHVWLLDELSLISINHSTRVVRMKYKQIVETLRFIKIICVTRYSLKMHLHDEQWREDDGLLFPFSFFPPPLSLVSFFLSLRNAERIVLRELVRSFPLIEMHPVPPLTTSWMLREIFVSWDAAAQHRCESVFPFIGCSRSKIKANVNQDIGNCVITNQKLTGRIKTSQSVEISWFIKL